MPKLVEPKVVALLEFCGPGAAKRKLGWKFEAAGFGEGDGLQDGDVPVLVAGAVDGVERHIAEGAGGGVLEGAGVEGCSGDAGLAVGLLSGDGVGTLLAVGVGEVGVGVGDGEPGARGERCDAGELPVADEVVDRGADGSGEPLAFADGEIPGVAGGEAMAVVEVEVAVLA